MRHIWAGLLMLPLWVGCKGKQEPTAAKVASAALSVSPSGTFSPAQAPEPKTKTAPAVVHLPAGCDVVVQLDLARLFSDPVLGPKLRSSLATRTTRAEPEDATQRAFFAFLEESQIEPAQDLEMIAGCWLRTPVGSDAPESSPGRFVVVLSGHMPGGVPRLMAKHAPQGKPYKLVQVGGQEALTKDGKWLSQASDHTLLFGNDEQLLAGAMVPGRAYTAYRLTAGQDANLLLGPELLRKQKALAGLNATSRLRRVQISVDLRGKRLHTAAEFPDRATLRAARGELERHLLALKQRAAAAPAAMRTMMTGLLEVAASAQFEEVGTTLKVHFVLPPDLLGSLVQQMALTGALGGLSGTPLNVPPYASAGLGGPRALGVGPGASGLRLPVTTGSGTLPGTQPRKGGALRPATKSP